MPRRSRIPARADEHAADGGVGTLDRALSILAAFTQDQPTPSLAQLAQATRLHKSTLLRMLASLVHAHLVIRLADGRYALGAEVERLQRVRAASVSTESLVMPVLQALAEQTGESSSYWVRQGDQRLCLFRVESSRPVRDHLHTGALLPLQRGAGGRVILAFSGARGAVYAALRREGVAVMAGDRDPEVAGVAAPVFDADGALAGAITLSMPAQRLQAQWAGPVKAAAQRLTRLLGGTAA
jgi:DNA-binding IclR family transcriptional regulator